MNISKPQDASQLNFDDFVCYAIDSAGHVLTRYYKPSLHNIGLTYPQYLAMVALWEGHEHTVESIAVRLSLDSHMLTPQLKRLETTGHIRRTRI